MKKMPVFFSSFSRKVEWTNKHTAHVLFASVYRFVPFLLSLCSIRVPLRWWPFHCLKKKITYMIISNTLLHFLWFTLKVHGLDGKAIHMEVYTDSCNETNTLSLTHTHIYLKAEKIWHLEENEKPQRNSKCMQSEWTKLQYQNESTRRKEKKAIKCMLYALYERERWEQKKMKNLVYFCMLHLRFATLMVCIIYNWICGCIEKLSMQMQLRLSARLYFWNQKKCKFKTTHF